MGQSQLPKVGALGGVGCWGVQIILQGFAGTTFTRKRRPYLPGRHAFESTASVHVAGRLILFEQLNRTMICIFSRKSVVE